MAALLDNAAKCIKVLPRADTAYERRDVLVSANASRLNSSVLHYGHVLETVKLHLIWTMHMFYIYRYKELPIIKYQFYNILRSLTFHGPQKSKVETC